MRCSGELTPRSLDCSLAACSDAAPAAADGLKRRRVNPASSGDGGGVVGGDSAAAPAPGAGEGEAGRD